MPNKVEFFSYNSHLLLSKTEVGDIVDSLFRGEDSFYIYGSMRPDRKSRPTLGLHVAGMLNVGHEIYLAPEKIKECFVRGVACGGNRKAPNIKLAMAMVLAHEIQHANQSIVHATHPTSFYGKVRSKYRARPCEREARTFADESLFVLAGILNIEVEKDKQIHIPEDEVMLVAECLSEADSICVSDIVNELRQSGLNNAVNVGKVKNYLVDWGVELV